MRGVLASVAIAAAAVRPGGGAVGSSCVCLLYAVTSPGIHLSPRAVGCPYAPMTYAGGPVSGGCFNPVVALAVAFRNFGTDLAPIFKKQVDCLEGDGKAWAERRSTVKGGLVASQTLTPIS